MHAEQNTKHYMSIHTYVYEQMCNYCSEMVIMIITSTYYSYRVDGGSHQVSGYCILKAIHNQQIFT